MPPLADVRFESVGAIVVAHIEGEIDLSNAEEIGTAIADHVSNEDHGLIIDLAQVDYIDSAGIHVIYELRERLSNRGQRLLLVIAPASAIVAALDFAGVQSSIGAAETLEAALAELGE
jgi:anti-sigma B factor antagonist